MTLARAQDVPVTIIGGGSNLLIADQGIRGLVIRARRRGPPDRCGTGSRRCRRDDQRSGPLDDCPRPGQPRSLGRHPGTVGGAIYGNAHFQGRNIGDLVDAVCLLSRDGRISDVPVGDMEFGTTTAGCIEPARLSSPPISKWCPGSLIVCVRLPAIRSPTASAPSRWLCRVPDASFRILRRDGIRCRKVSWSAGALVDRAGLKGAREDSTSLPPTATSSSMKATRRRAKFGP